MNKDVGSFIPMEIDLQHVDRVEFHRLNLHTILLMFINANGVITDIIIKSED